MLYLPDVKGIEKLAACVQWDDLMPSLSTPFNSITCTINPPSLDRHRYAMRYSEHQDRLSRADRARTVGQLETIDFSVLDKTQFSIF